MNLKATLESKHLEKREYLLVLGNYANNVPAIQILKNGGLECVATVNLWDGVEPNPGCVFLKGWSENEGLPESMVAAGLVEPTGRVEPTGFVEAGEYRMIGELAKAWEAYSRKGKFR